MSKLGRHRSSGGDLEALIRSSSNAIMLRIVIHALLCVAALVLGFSISREALLIVVSFRLPYGSLFVKTTTHPDGHKVAIISFPRMKQSRTFSESEFSVSHVTEQAGGRVTHPKETSLPMRSGDTEVQKESLAFTESKIMVHNTKVHTPSLQLPHAVTAPMTRSLSSRVHVGRHEILIRPWPHPDPSQTVVAHHLLRLVQAEQRHVYGLKERKQLLVITPTYAETFQTAHLTCLIHTLRLVPGPLIWIVVEAGDVSNETTALLASSTLSFRHLSLQEARPASAHLKARLRTEGLRFIHEHHLEGVVVFADDSITYELSFFDEVQKVKWFGVFPYWGTRDHDGADCKHVQDGLSSFAPKAINESSSTVFLQGPCNSSNSSVCWYPSARNESSQGISSIDSLNWSAFAFNARVLWGNSEVSWIKSWNEILAGNQTLVQSPLNLVKNSSQIESLRRCSNFL
eukprot:c24622_g2_i2 orf=527-1900(-)